MTYVGVAERPFGDLGRTTKARRIKRTLVREAEALIRTTESTDWKAASESLHRMHERWKKAGFAGEEHDQRLWKRFKKAGDQFRQLRTEHFAEVERLRQERVQERVSLKETLLSEAQGLSSISDYTLAKGRLSDFMSRWSQIGHTGTHEDKLWEQFVAAKQAMYDATAEDRRARQTEYVQRVEERIQNHREVIGKLRAQRRELMFRRRSVIPGWVGMEMMEEFDEQIENIDEYLAEREGWLEEDVQRVARARDQE